MRINNGTYFLVTNIGYGCSYAKIDEEQMEKMNHVKMPKITFLDEPTFQYPSINLQTTLHNHYETYQNSEKLISEYCLNYTTIFELNNEDLAQLKYRVFNSKHRNLLRKKELVGIAYKDRYGRIDVGLYLPVKSNAFLDIKPRKQKVYCFYDLYETRPDCWQ